MLTLFCTTLRRCALMLSSATLSRCSPVLMLSPATLRGRSFMLVLSALHRCSLMSMSGFSYFFGQVRRDPLDAKGLYPWHDDWGRGSRKGTGRVFAADHHRIIPCEQGTDTQ
jgi:hypothetical protein